MLRVFEMDGRHAVSTFGYHLLVGKLLKLGEGMICDSFLRATRALFHRGVFFRYVAETIEIDGILQQGYYLFI